MEQWRLDFDAGGPAAVHVSEFAEIRAVSPNGGELGREAYGRPANRRDLGHRCQFCRLPFSALGMAIVTDVQGPAQRFHAACWKLFCAAQLDSLGPQLPSSASDAIESPGAVSHRLTPRVVGGARANLVSAYADEWRSCHTSTTRRTASQARILRPSVLEGLNTVEDSRGEKKVANGFSQQEISQATALWAARASGSSSEALECAICLAGCADEPLRLPCGHVFCNACVEPWLRRCALCPMCRCDLRPALSTPGGRPSAGADLAGPSDSCHAAGQRVAAIRARLRGSKEHATAKARGLLSGAPGDATPCPKSPRRRQTKECRCPSSADSQAGEDAPSPMVGRSRARGQSVVVRRLSGPLITV